MEKINPAHKCYVWGFVYSCNEISGVSCWCLIIDWYSKEFFKKRILIVPDFVANAGGVISSYAEYRGYNPKRMFDLVSNKVRKATHLILSKSIKEKRNPREVGMEIACDPILQIGDILEFFIENKK